MKEQTYQLTPCNGDFYMLQTIYNGNTSDMKCFKAGRSKGCYSNCTAFRIRNHYYSNGDFGKKVVLYCTNEPVEFAIED